MLGNLIDINSEVSPCKADDNFISDVLAGGLQNGNT